jgi:tetratricopeptide (TPR) repeat protein
MFIRWHLKNGEYFNYETTDSKEIIDAVYDSIFQVSLQAKKNKVYMADLNDKQIAAINYVDFAFSIPFDSTEKILEICNKSINLDNNCVNALLMKGTAFVHKKDFKSATFIYNKILAYDSLNYKTYNNLAFLYYSQKDSKNAINCLSKAISCNPNDPEPYINRAEFYFSEGNLEKSMKDFDSATDYIKKCSFFQFSENYIRLDVLEKAIMGEYLKQNGN